MCEICSKLTLETPEQRQWRCSGFFIVNFEQISQIEGGVSIAQMSLMLNITNTSLFWTHPTYNSEL